MKTKRSKKAFAAALVFAFLATATAVGQSGFSMTKPSRQVDIPFDYENNFILLKVLFDRTFPLRFIFDTGAEHTVLTKREVPDALGLKYDREFRLIGADMQTELIAYLVRNVRFELADRAIAPHEAILVLDEDYFRFEEFAGVNVHGILGASAFSRFILKINYETQNLSLIDRDHFTPPRGYTAFDIEVFRNKPYLIAPIRLQNGQIFRAKLLIDTGAGLNMMLFTNIDSTLSLPAAIIPGNIGMGLGGFLEGFMGRTPSVDLSGFAFENVLTHFQAIDTSRTKIETLNGRHGLIGNGLLSRFSVILDYGDEKMYLRPIRKFDRIFEYDRSGLSVVTNGPLLSQFLVQNMLPASPASEAGIEKGDRIMAIGRLPAGLMSLEGLQKRLIGKAGKTVKLKIRRGEKAMEMKLRLRDLI